MIHSKILLLPVFGATLESHLKGDTSGYFKRLLVSLCNASRDESNTLDPSAAKADAQSLYQAGKARFGTDEVVFNQILCSRNFEQLKLIIKEYQLIGGHSLEQAIRDEFSGDIETGLLAIIKCVNSRSEFFASQLYRSMKGLGTNDSQLIRVVVTRSEIDMQDIKSTFFSKYGKTLKSFIEVLFMLFP